MSSNNLYSCSTALEALRQHRPTVIWHNIVDDEHDKTKDSILVVVQKLYLAIYLYVIRILVKVNQEIGITIVVSVTIQIFHIGSVMWWYICGFNESKL